MKILRRIVESLVPPSKSDLWIKDGVLKYFSKGSWKNLGGGIQEQEIDKNGPYIITINQENTTEDGVYLGREGVYQALEAAEAGRQIVIRDDVTKETLFPIN